MAPRAGIFAAALLAAAAAPGLGMPKYDQPNEAVMGRPYPWAGKNGDSLRTGASSFIVTKDISHGPSWTFHERLPPKLFQRAKYALSRAAPLIDDEGSIYYSTVTSGNVYKFSRNGTKIWKFNAGGDQLPDIGALWNGQLFISTHRAEVICLDMDTGTPLWRKRVGTRAAGDTWSMTVADGIVMTACNGEDRGQGGNNNRFVAVSANDGKELWTYTTPGDIYNILVAVHDGSAVFSTSAGRVIRLRIGDGSVVWQTPEPAQASFSTGGTVIGPNGVVYSTWNEGREGGMSWGNGVVAATRFKDGKQLWKANVTYAANNAASVGVLADGRLGVVVGLGDNPNKPNPFRGIGDDRGPTKRQRILALDAETGEERWTYDLPDWHGSALGDDHRPDICLPDAFGNVAIGGDGTAYVGHASGLLYALGDSNGDGEIGPGEVSTFQAGAAFQGTPAIAKGLLAATPCDGLHVWLEEESDSPTRFMEEPKRKSWFP